jgi:[ribosomal protein S18]-alanine N-acetyltransferase
MDDEPSSHRADSPMNIRRARPADLPAIMALEALGFVPGTHEEADVYAERIAVFPDGFLVAEDEGGTMLGCISSELWPFTDPPAHERFSIGHSIADIHSPANDEIYISSMTVAPQARGHRLGERLFTECIARCKRAYPQVRSAILLVNETWVHARRIYERQGFTEIMRLPGFFRPAGLAPADGIVMRKELRDGTGGQAAAGSGSQASRTRSEGVR